MSTQPIPFVTPEQYLEIERNAEFRSEYLNGQMFAMSGASRRHSRIAINTGAQLWNQLRGGRCEVAGSDLRLAIPSRKLWTYPDLVITCRPEKFVDEQQDTLADATVIIEVLSPSTMDYDRGEKFRYYRTLPSFAEYLLLAQDTMRAEHHVRQPDGSWLFREFSSAESVLELASIGCKLTLGTLYENVDFTGEAASPPPGSELPTQ